MSPLRRVEAVPLPYRPTECSPHVDSSRRLLSSWRCRFGSSAVGRVARNPLNHFLMVVSETGTSRSGTTEFVPKIGWRLR